MTVKNFTATISGGSVIMSWEASEAFSFVYQDAEIIARLGAGVRSLTTSYVPGAVYQVADSATSSPDPPLPYNVPQRRITIEWAGNPDVARYLLDISGFTKSFTGGDPSYSFKTSRLNSGNYLIALTGFDFAGNQSDDSSKLTIIIDDVPPPVQGIVLTQPGGPGTITATITPPTGW